MQLWRCFPSVSNPSIFRSKTAPRPEAGPVCHQFLGDLSERDPPVPIPNTVVKPLSPDGTARASVWESRKSPGLSLKPSPTRRAFLRGIRQVLDLPYFKSRRPACGAHAGDLPNKNSVLTGRPRTCPTSYFFLISSKRLAR